MAFTVTVAALLMQWLDTLAALLSSWRSAWRARRSIVIARRDDGLVVRQRLRDGPMDATSPLAEAISGDGKRNARQRFVIFELPEQQVLVRQIKVPAQALEFLPGIVRNQIDRLSPWPLSDALYGFEAQPSASEAGMLDVQIPVAARSMMERARDELGAAGLPLDQVVLRRSEPSTQTPIVLWSRTGNEPSGQVQSARWAIGGAIAATVVLSAVVSGWALWSAAGFDSDAGDAATRIKALQRRLQVGRTAEALAALPLPERAWALKEASSSSVIALEALSRALPDSAYLSDFRLEKGILRITGLTSDAPALLAPLERSGHFSNVRFSAATTRSAEQGLFTFNIEASQERRPGIDGE